MKIFWGVMAVGLIIMIIALPIFRNTLFGIYTMISSLNSNFFGSMPAWFNFGIGTLVLALIFSIANGFRG